MIRRLTQLRLPFDHPPEALRAAILAHLAIPESDLRHIQTIRRGIDARRAPRIFHIYTLDLDLADHAAPHLPQAPDTTYRHVAQAPPNTPRPVVIGAGPCGLFAALTLAQMGFRPILIESGKPVRDRTKDTFRFWRQGVLDPASNVQFGEGGAGTFSDGKLYSQVRDRAHRGKRILQTFVEAGAPAEILTVSHPHIGTFRLVTVVEHIRKTIESLGGEYRFSTTLTGLEIYNNTLTGLHLQTPEGDHYLPATSVILAPGHSARTTFAMLHHSGIPLTPKPFSIGVRIEHPQGLIDRARYAEPSLQAALGAADYRLAHHCRNGRTAYSFCMCPGGTVVAAASEPGGLVTNGMSQYSRAERNANAGLVVEITPADFPTQHPLAGIDFQRHWEHAAYAAGGSTYAAPAQRLEDFVAARPSTHLGSVLPSYTPRVTPTDLSLCLPPYVIEALREAIPAFARQLPGFDLPDALLTGVETRTSSPLRIERDATGQSPTLAGLFPAGEGAGYAGGILSAAIDGTRAAEALALATLGRSPAIPMQTASGFYD